MTLATFGSPSSGFSVAASAAWKAADVASALAAYEQLVTTHNMNRLYNGGLTLAPALKRLGELYEARGEFQLTVEGMRRAGEGDLYQRFLMLRDRLQRAAASR